MRLRARAGIQIPALINMENIDPVFECDAPLYVDFEQIKQSGFFDDDGADSWFGE